MAMGTTRVLVAGSISMSTAVDGPPSLSSLTGGLRLKVPLDSERVLHVSYFRKCCLRPEAAVKVLLQFLQTKGFVPSCTLVCSTKPAGGETFATSGADEWPEYWPYINLLFLPLTIKIPPKQNVLYL